MGGLLLADPREHEAQEGAHQEHRAAVGREGRTAASREVGAVGDVGEVDDEKAAHVVMVASVPGPCAGWMAPDSAPDYAGGFIRRNRR